MWAEDRIHLTSEGHRRVALAALSALGHAPADDDWTAPLPPGGPGLPRARSCAATHEWVRTHAGPWVQRRIRGVSSGDALCRQAPRLTHFRDPHDEPPHEPLPEG